MRNCVAILTQKTGVLRAFSALFAPEFSVRPAPEVQPGQCAAVFVDVAAPPGGLPGFDGHGIPVFHFAADGAPTSAQFGGAVLRFPDDVAALKPVLAARQAMDAPCAPCADSVPGAQESFDFPDFPDFPRIRAVSSVAADFVGNFPDSAAFSLVASLPQADCASGAPPSGTCAGGAHGFSAPAPGISAEHGSVTGNPGVIPESLSRAFVGQSRAVRALQERILLAAQSDVPVLIVGESGTGKSRAARQIHGLSVRAGAPFMAVNVSSVPESVAESELFGTVRGAFTDAADRDGYFLSADGGTLFLDEIGDLGAGVQAKILTALETGEFRAVGSDAVKRSNVRVICATNADLRRKMALREFRDDLYYRIARFVLRVPPLRERREDIPALSAQFLAENAPGKLLSPAAAALLGTFPWQGNVRQLHSCLWNAAMLAGASPVILPAHIEYF